MLSDECPPAFPADLPPSKKARLTMDEAIAAMTCHNDKLRADDIERDNAEESRLLKLPQELLEMIYDHVYNRQIIQLYLSAGNQARISHTTQRHPFALPGTCRKLRQDTVRYPYTKTTFQIVTYRFVSMFGTLGGVIRHDPNALIDFLESIPAPWIEHIEVIGVRQLNKSRRARPEQGDENGANYSVDLEETIRMIYKDADITFRTVESFDQI